MVYKRGDIVYFVTVEDKTIRVGKILGTGLDTYRITDLESGEEHELPKDHVNIKVDDLPREEMDARREAVGDFVKYTVVPAAVDAGLGKLGFSTAAEMSPAGNLGKILGREKIDNRVNLLIDSILQSLKENNSRILHLETEFSILSRGLKDLKDLKDLEAGYRVAQGDEDEGEDGSIDLGGGWP